MPDLEDGETAEIQGSGSSVYKIRNTGGVYSCSCPAWRNQSIAIETRTCKHIRKLRGDEAETLRVGEAGSAPRKAKSEDGESQEAPVLLAESWDGVVEVKDWWISEKLDGVRAYWDGKQFLSRQGNQYFAPDWFTAGLPDYPLDDELWLERKQFQKTISIVRRQDKSDHWKNIRYVVFDAPQIADPFEKRIKALEELFKSKKLAYASALEQIRCNGIPHLKEELARVESLGGEGLMLRQPGSKYVVGRSSTLLKVKSFFDAEAVVIGHQGGAGRHKGRLGALLVKLPDGTEFGVGTGFSDAQRENPPPVGSKITFRYQELTDGGVPRFPVYLKTEQQNVASFPSSETTKSIPAPRKPAVVSPPAKAVEVKAAVAKPSTHAAKTGTARMFTYQDDKSDKFWEITVNDCEVTVRYGRTGTNGQTNVKSFANSTKAQEHSDKLIEEKTEKGYEERGM